MNTLKLLVLCLILVLLSIACNSTITSSKNEYPAILTPLPHQQLQEKIDAFHASNNFRICSELDGYGLTTGKGCFSPAKKSTEKVSKQNAIIMAKNALVKNKLYTNVVDTEKLQINRAYPTNATNDEWRIGFQAQLYKGYTVKNTPIVVWLNAKGVYRIDGHWFKKIIIPDNSNVSRKAVLKAAIGYKINYSDWTGPKHLVVNEHLLPSPDELQLKILPYQSGDNLQLRAVWKITLTNNFAALFVDSMNKKVLDYRQLILF